MHLTAMLDTRAPWLSPGKERKRGEEKQNRQEESLTLSLQLLWVLLRQYWFSRKAFLTKRQFPTPQEVSELSLLLSTDQRKFTKCLSKGSYKLEQAFCSWLSGVSSLSSPSRGCLYPSSSLLSSPVLSTFSVFSRIKSTRCREPV